MFGVSQSTVSSLKRQYPVGTRVSLIKMDDPYRTIPPGTLGTVTGVDNIGNIHVDWDNGSTLAVIYREDRIMKI